MPAPISRHRNTETQGGTSLTLWTGGQFSFEVCNKAEGPQQPRTAQWASILTGAWVMAAVIVLVILWSVDNVPNGSKCRIS